MPHTLWHKIHSMNSMILVSWKTLNTYFMPHTLDHYESTGIWMYFSVFWSMIFHAMFNQTRQSSVKAPVLHTHLLIPVFIHTHPKPRFLMHLLNYSFTDGSILPGIHLQTNWKTFSVISIPYLPTMATIFIFHSNQLKSQGSKTQIFSQLKITNQKATLSFLSQPPAPNAFFSMKILASQIVSKEMHRKAKIFSEHFKNLSHLRK